MRNNRKIRCESQTKSEEIRQKPPAIKTEPLAVSRKSDGNLRQLYTVDDFPAEEQQTVRIEKIYADGG